MDTRRDETDAERYDRNWSELVQELRVAQTGVQVTVGLMTAPVARHRFLFGRHEKDVLVPAGHVFAKARLLAAGAVLVFFVGVWVVLPLSLLHRGTGSS